MGFTSGIVGLPNVGKSTLFNALTKIGVDAANFPFCTVDRHTGVVSVPDERLTKVVDLVKPQRVVPAVIEVVDIAGLVAGASRGEGLGNQFLGYIREVDAIAHVVRCFDDTNIIHVANRVSPRSDIETVQLELVLADLQTMHRALEKAQRKVKANDREAIELKDLLENKIIPHLDSAKALRTLILDQRELTMLQYLHPLTTKPTMYIANIGEDGFDLARNQHYLQVQDIAHSEGTIVVPVCAALEAELSELEDNERLEFLTALGLDDLALPRVIKAGYALLGLQTFFTTTGGKEVRAWTIKIGTAAIEAAGIIHSDFQRGFIRAEVVAYRDYVQYGGEIGAKEVGKWRLEGRDYIVQDGDIIHFRSNV
jgi:hypothetical protein